jgi:hypothetical protein
MMGFSAIGADGGADPRGGADQTIASGAAVYIQAINAAAQCCSIAAMSR